MMAEAPKSIFNKRAAEKLRNPDDLDKYVRITNPSVWVTLAACVAMLAGLLAWGIFGAVTTSVKTTGAVIDTTAVAQANADIGIEGTEAAVCFLSAEDVAKVSVGDTAEVGGVKMTVTFVSSVPNSPDEWDKTLGSQYLVKALFDGDWAYPVVFDGDVSRLDKNVPVAINITTDRVAPISLILKNRS